jgi:hypothetical protein
VVHNYGDVCQAITEMATQQDANISANDFRMLNHCLDNAIASAVTEFNRDDEPSLNEAADHHEQVMMLARLLRNSIRTGVLAMEAVKSGLVGMAGSTGGLLVLSTVDSERLINRLIAALNVDRSTQSQTVQQ